MAVHATNKKVRVSQRPKKGKTLQIRVSNDLNDRILKHLEKFNSEFDVSLKVSPFLLRFLEKEFK